MYDTVVVARWPPKIGAPLDECEDATSPAAGEPSPGVTIDGVMAAAVADGATTYSYSREWAEIICEQQARAPLADAESLLARLPEWQAQWEAAVGDRVANLPWFAAAKAEQGAFSTFLQLSLCVDGPAAGRWQALAVGDSCVAQCRNEKLVGQALDGLPVFPLQTSEAFTRRPYLLPTRRDLIDKMAEHVQTVSGHFRVGDEFILMTDALAAWFVGELEEGRSPLEQLRPFLPPRPVRIPMPVAVPASPSHDQALPSEGQGQSYKPLGKLLQELYPTSPAAAIAPGARDHEDINAETSPALPSFGSQGSTEDASVNLKFENWVEDMKAQGKIKDDDISFVYVQVSGKGEPHA